MRKLLRLTTAVVVVVLLGSTPIVSAINYGGIGASPAYPNPSNPRTQSIFIYQLKPGQSASDGVRVINNTPQSQTVTVDVVDSELTTEGSFTCKQASEPKTGVGNWIQLQSTSVSLVPNSSQIVPFVVSVPNSSSLSVGEHDGCITIQAASETATQSSRSGILLSFRTAIRVVVTIPGKIVKKLSISKVEISHNHKGDYQVMAVLNNDGNVSLDTLVKTKWVSIIGTGSNQASNGNTPILPNSSATLNYGISHPFWGGWYKLQLTASYNNNPTAELGVNSSGSSTTKISDSAVAFIAPKPLAGFIEIVILLALLAAIYFWINNNRRARHIKVNWQLYTVKNGDTLRMLAESSSIGWKQLAKVNKLKPPYDLRAGQKLKLPKKG